MRFWRHLGVGGNCGMFKICHSDHSSCDRGETKGITLPSRCLNTSTDFYKTTKSSAGTDYLVSQHNNSLLFLSRLLQTEGAHFQPLLITAGCHSCRVEKCLCTRWRFSLCHLSACCVCGGGVVFLFCYQDSSNGTQHGSKLLTSSGTWRACCCRHTIRAAVRQKLMAAAKRWAILAVQSWWIRCRVLKVNEYIRQFKKKISWRSYTQSNTLNYRNSITFFLLYCSALNGNVSACSGSQTAVKDRALH